MIVSITEEYKQFARSHQAPPPEQVKAKQPTLKFLKKSPRQLSKTHAPTIASYYHLFKYQPLENTRAPKS